MIVVTRGETVLAAAGLDLDRSELGEFVFLPGADGQDLFETVLSGIEQLAVRFGFRKLGIRATATCRDPFSAAGYRAEAADKGGALVLSRSLERRLTNYARRVQSIGETLGIPGDYGQRHRLSLHAEATRLDSIGPDIFGRDQRLAPRAAAAWQRMRHAALASGIDLQAVSHSVSALPARSAAAQIVQGQVIEDILKVSAAPGYSEHHSGRAIDVTTPGFAALEEALRTARHSPGWINTAEGLASGLFPRGNRHGRPASHGIGAGEVRHWVNSGSVTSWCSGPGQCRDPESCTEWPDRSLTRAARS
jgi:D-alanyl-D-alanine carboxypeptidase